MLRAILFDIDDTLIDWQSAVRRASRSQGVHRGLPWEEAGRPPAANTPGRRVPPAWRARAMASVQPDGRVSALLAELAGTYRLAAVSNGAGVVQREKLRRAALAEAVECVVISGEVGVRKPGAGIFRRALAALGCRAEEALFVGNDLTTDVAGAAEAGLRTCWVAADEVADESAYTSDVRIATVLDLPRVLPCLTSTA